MKRNKTSLRTRWLGGLAILVGTAGLGLSIFGPEWAQTLTLPLVVGASGVMAASVAADARSNR
jgi:hypothetical protein